MNTRNHAGSILAICLTICVSRYSEGAAPSEADATVESLPISQLQSNLAKLRSEDASGQEEPGLIRKYRLELAKRGDSKCRTEIFAELKSEDLPKQSKALEDTAAIGDREAIAQLATVLFDTNPGGRHTRDHAYLAPRIVAAMKLARIVRNPPVPPIGPEKKFYTDEDVAKWREWWSKEGGKLPKSQ